MRRLISRQLCSVSIIFSFSLGLVNVTFYYSFHFIFLHSRVIMLNNITSQRTRHPATQALSHPNIRWTSSVSSLLMAHAVLDWYRYICSLYFSDKDTGFAYFNRLYSLTNLLATVQWLKTFRSQCIMIYNLQYVVILSFYRVC